MEEDLYQNIERTAGRVKKKPGDVCCFFKANRHPPALGSGRLYHPGIGKANTY
jgi:hypothetical protein